VNTANASPTMGRRALLTLAVGTATAAIGAPLTARPPAPDPYLIRIATGPAGPTDVLNNELVAAAAGAAVRIQPVCSAGSLQNLHLLTQHHVDAAMVLTDAITGHETKYCAVAKLFEHYVQVVVRPDSPVRHVGQLRGARVVAGADGSGAALTGTRILQAAGLHPGTDVEVTHLPLQESVAALRNHSVDAIIWIGAIPTPELGIPYTARLVDLDSVIAPLRATYPTLYDRVGITKTVYQLPVEYHLVGISTLLLVNRHVPDFAVESLADLLLQHSHQLLDGSTGSQFMDDGSLINTWPVRLHPGAAQAYRRAHR